MTLVFPHTAQPYLEKIVHAILNYRMIFAQHSKSPINDILMSYRYKVNTCLQSLLINSDFDGLQLAIVSDNLNNVDIVLK